MKWKTHIAIAKAISKSLNLPKDLEKALSQGSIEPDKYPDKVLRVERRGECIQPQHLIMIQSWG